VTAIRKRAFKDNPLTSITIGAKVKLVGGEYASFPNAFSRFYMFNGKRAGTYRLEGSKWTYSR
jgi:hypothetical protein